MAFSTDGAEALSLILERLKSNLQEGRTMMRKSFAKEQISVHRGAEGEPPTPRQGIPTQQQYLLTPYERKSVPPT